MDEFRTKAHCKVKLEPGLHVYRKVEGESPPCSLRGPGGRVSGTSCQWVLGAELVVHACV